MGWLIAAAVILLLAIFPLGVMLRYDGAGLRVRIAAGFLAFTVYPRKKKTKPKNPDGKALKKSEQKQTAPEKAKKKQGGSLTDFLPLARIGVQFLNSLRKKIRVAHLDLWVLLAEGDPCDLGTHYGQAQAAVSGLMPLLDRALVIKKRDIRVLCDFEGSQTKIYADTKLTLTLGRAVGLICVYGVRVLRAYLTMMNKRKGGALQ